MWRLDLKTLDKWSVVQQGTVAEIAASDEEQVSSSDSSDDDA